MKRDRYFEQYEERDYEEYRKINKRNPNQSLPINWTYLSMRFTIGSKETRDPPYCRIFDKDKFFQSMKKLLKILKLDQFKPPKIIMFDVSNQFNDFLFIKNQNIIILLYEMNGFSDDTNKLFNHFWTGVHANRITRFGKKSKSNIWKNKIFQDKKKNRGYR